MAHSFTFNGVDMADYGLTLLRHPHQLLPDLDQTLTKMSLTSRSVATPFSFMPRTFELPCIVRGSTKTERDSFLQSIAKALAEPTPQQLIFDSDTSLYYNAVLNGGISLEKINATAALLSIRMVAPDPCAYSVSEVTSGPHTLTQPFSVEIAAAGGTASSYPTIEIDLGADTTLIEIENETTIQRIAYATPAFSGMKLLFVCDPSIWTVYAEMPGSEGEWTALMTNVTGKFPEISHLSTNSIQVTGVAAGTMTITYRNRYL